MSEFKEMKFWIGDDAELSERVQNILFILGCRWFSGDAVQITSSTSLYVDGGCITYGGHSRKEDWFDKQSHKEINIDWLRTAKPETVELGGKTYIKSELEEALSHINPLSDTGAGK